jgi:protocatechuate 3,4-dioxygenase beta subunit
MRNTKSWSWLVGAITIVIPSGSATALIVGGTTEPMKDLGWPSGVVELANLKTRVAWCEGPPFGGGEFHFEYRGDTVAFLEALKLFAAVRAPELELVVHGGAGTSFWLKADRDPKANTKIDWTFTVWIPANWHALYNNPSSYFTSDHANFRKPVAPPRIDVYVGGGIDWKQIRVPPGIRVEDVRASSYGYLAADNAVIVGTVYDIATGRPVANARVVVERPAGKEPPQPTVQTETDNRGRFHLERIPPGICRVAVHAHGYAPRQIAYQRLEPDSLHRFTVELAATVDVEGQVVDADDDKPVAGAEVQLTRPMSIDGRGYVAPEPPRAMTGSDGRFKLAGVATGYAQFRCVAAGYYHNPIGRLHRFPSESVRLAVVRTGAVQVQVFDADGRPITKDYLIAVEPEQGAGIGKWGGSANVREDGSVRFDGVPPGRYRIYGRPNPGAVGDRSSDQIIEVKRGETVKLRTNHSKSGGK